MFSVLYEDGYRYIVVKETGQKWCVEYDVDVRNFVQWLNDNVIPKNEHAENSRCAHRNTNPISGFCYDCRETIMYNPVR